MDCFSLGDSMDFFTDGWLFGVVIFLAAVSLICVALFSTTGASFAGVVVGTAGNWSCTR